MSKELSELKYDLYNAMCNCATLYTLTNDKKYLRLIRKLERTINKL